MTFGLTDDTIRAIHAVLLLHPEVERAIVYGSRAKNCHRPGSDIDLALVGERLSFSILLQLINEMDNLPIPYTVDLALVSGITDPDLVDHIKRVGVVFFERDTETVDRA
jgi:uncharacterized protein